MAKIREKKQVVTVGKLSQAMVVDVQMSEAGAVWYAFEE